MTKRHFEEFARLIRESAHDESHKHAAAAFVCIVARQFNPRFDT